MPAPKRRPRGTVPNERPLDDILRRKPRPKDDSQWIVQDRDGDYIESIESTGWECVKWHFHWTKYRDFAHVFTGEELLGKDGTMNLIVAGFAGATAIKIKERTQHDAERL